MVKIDFYRGKIDIAIRASVKEVKFSKENGY